MCLRGGRDRDRIWQGLEESEPGRGGAQGALAAPLGPGPGEDAVAVRRGPARPRSDGRAGRKVPCRARGGSRGGDPEPRPSGELKETRTEPRAELTVRRKWR